MKLEHCPKHDHCTIVDGEHVARTPAVEPVGYVKDEKFEKEQAKSDNRFREATRDAQDIKDDVALRFGVLAEQVRKAVSGLDKRVEKAESTVVKEVEASEKFRATKRGQKADLPARVAEAEKTVADLAKSVSALTDAVTKLGEDLAAEAKARKAEIRQLMAL